MLCLKPFSHPYFYKQCTFVLVFIFWCSSTFGSTVLELSVKGPIGPASADYVVRGIAKGADADLILIKLDTPGGLGKSMRQIVQSILTSTTPVVVYVAPSGARAASAGTYILYASTVAAMAPGTHLGAASPVNIGGSFGDKEKNDSNKSTMKKKLNEDAKAYIRTLAQLRDRDPGFAHKAVMDAATLTAIEAKKQGVIDLIASNTQDLFQQLNGRVVQQNGQSIKLNVANPHINEYLPDWRMKWLLVITDPTIAYMLLLLGIYGLFFEFFNPGFVVPGVIGGIALFVALYALQLLPINYAGLALIVLGFGFIIAELFAPSFGILGIGGTLAFIMGSIFLMDTEEVRYQIAWSAIWAMAAANVLVFGVLMGMGIRAKKKPVQHGMTMLIHAKGRSLNAINPEGQAVIRGEIWSVYARAPIAKDKPIVVVATDGLKLEVTELQGEQ